MWAGEAFLFEIAVHIAGSAEGRLSRRETDELVEGSVVNHAAARIAVSRSSMHSECFGSDVVRLKGGGQA